MTPQSAPGGQSEIRLSQWSAAPANAAMVAFGNLAVNGGRLTVNGFLDDAKNPQYPQIFARQYSDTASDNNARQIAHKFADEIIAPPRRRHHRHRGNEDLLRQADRPSKEIWGMDYDGANQHQITHVGYAISPRISPDNSRIAFSSLGAQRLSDRHVLAAAESHCQLRQHRRHQRLACMGAQRPAARLLLLAHRRSRDLGLRRARHLAHRITDFKGPDVSPTWNPKTGAQIAWISGRTGLPQLYIMDSDGSGVQRLTDGGYATSPSWSPNGQFLAFAWDRKYGPGAPGGQDIYVMEIATKKWIQLTHDGGRCDFPSWSPDGRHLVYANSSDGRADHTRIMTMLADGHRSEPSPAPAPTCRTGAGGNLAMFPDKRETPHRALNLICSAASPHEDKDDLTTNLPIPKLTTILFSASIALLAATGCHNKAKTLPPPSALPPSASAPAPTATITADPQAIDQGQSVVLNWRTTNATPSPSTASATSQSTAHRPSRLPAPPTSISSPKVTAAPPKPTSA